MAVSFKHSTSASGSNNPTKQVSVDAWNADHTLSGTGDTLLGFSSGGAATEITSDDITLADGVASVTGANILNNVADRTALAAITTMAAGHSRFLTESGREGTFIFDSSDLSAEVTADTAQGIYVAPSSDTTGASGAWVRKFDGAVNPAWFGLTEGDSSANGAANDAAMLAMFAVLAARKTAYVAGTTNYGLERVRFPYGIYWFASTIEVTDGQLIIEGPAGGLSNSGFVLKFPAGVTGIRVHGSLTSGANTKDGVAHSSAQGSVLRHLNLYGAFTTTEAEAHGVQLRTTATLENISVTNFEGDGFYCAAASGAATGATPAYGNINQSMFLRCKATSCRNGMFFDGSDANACAIIEPYMQQNRQWGIWDSSGSGNSYFGGNCATNGLTGDGVTIAATVVNYNGGSGTKRYYPIVGQEVGASTNAPSGTSSDNTWWGYIGDNASATAPTWVSGLSIRSGGCIHDDETISNSIYSGIYVEQDQGKAQVVQKSLIMGGYLSQWVYTKASSSSGTAVVRSGTNGVFEALTAVQSTSSSTTARIGATNDNPSSIALFASHSTIAPTGYNLFFSGNDTFFSYGAVTTGASVAYEITGPSTAEQFGTGAAVAHAFWAPRLMVGPNTNSTANSRRIMIDTAAPATGAHGVGEWCFHRGTGYKVASKCTVAGTPGTWTEVYGVASSLGGAAQAAARANSVAADVATLVSDFNDLLAKLRTAGLLAT